MSIKVTVKKKNPLARVRGNNKVQVGWFEEGKVGMLAGIFTHGGGRWGNVPAYDPLSRASLDILEAGKEIVRQEAADMILNGKSNALKRVALKGSEILKEKVESIKSPGNRASTIAKKGFDNPMIDKGNFKRAATGKVNGIGNFGKGKLG